MSARACIPQARFTAIRAAVLAARAARDENDISLAVKYGPGRMLHWYSASERKLVERLQRAYDRACDRMFALLDKSDRDWRSGVPAVWVACELTYADAIKPRTTPLDVTPPLAYGQREPMQ